MQINKMQNRNQKHPNSSALEINKCIQYKKKTHYLKTKGKAHYNFQSSLVQTNRKQDTEKVY